MHIDDVFQSLEVPAESSYVPVRPAEGRFMHEWIKRHNLQHTLEVGFAYGASTASIMSAHGGRHTSLDPFQEQHYQNLGLRNITSLGFHDRLRFVPDFSHNALPQLLAEKQQYDFIFIDGDHRYDGIALDFFYADRLLQQNGYVLFHDSWMRGTQLVAKFIRSNRRDYRAVPCPIKNLVLFQKIGADGRDWNHFREFYTWRGFFSHRLVLGLVKFGFLRNSSRFKDEALKK